jgi:hypothetical protein
VADTSEQRVARLRARLAESRHQVFDLAHAMKGEGSGHEGSGSAPEDSGFPHSRLMRLLMGKHVGVALGTAAVAATLLRPRLLLKALRLTPMLKPMLMRYVLPRLLGQR